MKEEVREERKKNRQTTCLKKCMITNSRTLTYTKKKKMAQGKWSADLSVRLIKWKEEEEIMYEEK